jgi:hypothetical protein
MDSETIVLHNALLSLLKLQGSSTFHDQLRTIVILAEKQALCCRDSVSLAVAKELYQEAVDNHRAVMGETHPDTLAMMHKLATIMLRLKEFENAEKVYRKTLGGRNLLFGKDDQLTLDSANNLAVLFCTTQQQQHAERLFRRVLAGRRKSFEEIHLDVLNAQSNLGVALVDTEESTGEAYNLLVKVYRGRHSGSASQQNTAEALDSKHNLAVALFATTSEISKAKGEKYHLIVTVVKFYTQVFWPRIFQSTSQLHGAVELKSWALLMRTRWHL